MIIKKKKENEYYNPEPIDSLGATYNIVYGKRSNGKTFSFLSKAIERYYKFGFETAYIRRYESDIKGQLAKDVFSGINSSGIVSKLTKNEFDCVIYDSRKWYLAKWDGDLNKYIKDSTPFCHGFSLTQEEHIKGITYPNIYMIIFDEVISRKGYLRDEFVTFMNVLSTIIRRKDNVKIYMLGNTINKYFPYAKEMGLKHLKKQQPGTIELYEYNNDLKVAVEYCHNLKNESIIKSEKYFAFDNPKLKMITNGEWEVDIYPHFTGVYNEDEILYHYYIEFDEDYLQCDIILRDNEYITYVHDVQKNINFDDDIIYTIKYNTKPNYRRNILKPTDSITQKIYNFYKREKVFYDNNENGEIMNNYLKWCTSIQ